MREHENLLTEYEQATTESRTLRLDHHGLAAVARMLDNPLPMLASPSSLPVESVRQTVSLFPAASLDLEARLLPRGETSTCSKQGYYGGPYYYGGGPYYAAPAYEVEPGYYEEGGGGGGGVEYCMRRFRSYDPSSGTYMGYDGQRYPCP